MCQSIRTTSRLPHSKTLPVLILVVVCLHAVVYSQTLAYYEDEGFELVAAQLVASGHQPYLDFFYQHTPFFLYIMAAWMKVFGSGWQAAHLLSALFTCGSLVLIVLVVDSLWSGRVAKATMDRGWRSATVASVVVLFGCHALVTRYGNVGQAYGASLFFAAAAFYAATKALDSNRALSVFLAGLASAAAAGCSLLTVPIGAAVLGCLIWWASPDKRLRTAGWFALGAIVGSLPLLWLLWRSPRTVFFDVVLYHLRYRQAYRSLHWDWEVLQTLTDPQGLILMFLALFGFLFVVGFGREEVPSRRGFTLSAILAAGLAVLAAITRPTFPQYFVIAVPFVAVVASAGVMAIGSRLLTPTQRPWVAAVALWPFLLTPIRTTHQLIAHAYRPWQGLEGVGEQVNAVTPPAGVVFANQLVYAAARRLPPRGLESEFALDHAEQDQPIYSDGIKSRDQLADWLRSGHFDTAVYCEDDPHPGVDLVQIYRNRARVKYKESTTYCDVFWQPTPRGGSQ